MKKIEELQKRKSLNEDRNFGIGFSILKPNSKATKFKTYLPFTACRDYLNDFSYVENNKKEIGSIHGYNHKLLNCFDDKRFFYFGVNTLNYNCGVDWKDKDEAEKILKENYKNLELLLNKIENKIGLFKSRTSITLDEDTLIIKTPSYWNKTTALISLYSLIIRCCFNIKDISNNLVDTINNHKPFINNDSMMKGDIIKFIELNNYQKISKIDYKEYNIISNSNIHNFGINGYFKKLIDKKADIEE